MKPDAKDLFARAHELSGKEREAFLDAECGGDAELRLEVQRLLVKAEQADAFFSDDDGATLVAAAFDATYAEQEGDVIGPYILRQQIGEGGFGTVWMAEQKEPIHRMVALKVIKAGMDTKQVLARFEAERQALAMMDHPNIARVLDAGATPTGRPYFAMELVKGIPITEFCDKQKYGPRRRLELFRDVCSAVNHAHQKGIIHRDLKPSNIMVTLEADKPVVKVIDFGISKATHSKLTEKTLFTRFEQFLGTPVYMSPEQAAMSNLDIDTRSDIYSLGVLLYELLVGAPPFDQHSLLSAGYDEMRRIIAEDEPPKPSTRRTQIQSSTGDAAGNGKPKVSASVLKGDLDWIVMKAIEKDRTRRYETANAFAADVARYLHDEPVLAAAPGAAYKFRKFARRNKTAMRVAAVILAALVAATAVSSWQAVRATKAEKQALAERDAKDQALKESQAISTFLTDLLESPDPTKYGLKLTVVDLIDYAAERLETELADQPEHRARLHATLANTYSALGYDAKAIPLREDMRDASLRRLGPEHPETIKAMSQLAKSYYIADRREEALKMREEVLALSRKVNSPEHPDTIQAMHDLATSYGAANRGNEGFKMQEEVLALSRKVNGPEHPKTIDAMNNLAVFHFKAGRNDEALKMQEEVLALSRRVNGPEHPRTIMALNNLAGSHMQAGHKDDAMKMLEEALTLSRKVHGPRHPATLGVTRYLLEDMNYAGSDEMRIELYEDALETARNVYGQEHDTTLDMMHNLAISYDKVGRKDEALRLREQVLPLRLKLVGPEDPDTLRAMSNLAKSYNATGRRGEALTMFEEVLALSRKVNGPEHPDTVRAMHTLVYHKYNTDRTDETLTMFEEVLALSRKVLGPEHPDTLLAMCNLAKFYSDAGRLDEALKLCEELLALRRKPPSPEHPGTIEAIAKVADACHKTGFNKEEEFKLRLELRTFYRNTKCENEATLWNLRLLSLMHDKAGRYEEALKLREEWLTLAKKVAGPGSRNHLDAMRKLAGSYEAAGRKDDSAKLREELQQLMAKHPQPQTDPRPGPKPSPADALVELSRQAIVHRTAKRFDEAAKAGEELLAIHRRVNGPEHSDTINAMSELLKSYGAAGRKDEERKLREELVFLLRPLNRPNDQTLLWNLHMLANDEKGSGHLDEALKLREEALALSRKIHGETDGFTLLIMSKLAEIHEAAGRKDEAAKVRAEIEALKANKAEQ